MGINNVLLVVLRQFFDFFIDIFVIVSIQAVLCYCLLFYLCQNQHFNAFPTLSFVNITLV